MHYVSRGRGAPPLVFVHGFTGDHTDWQLQADHFEAKQQVVACDLRGHGKTPGRPAECTIEHYGGDVAALAANLELSKAILVGHSMGCRVVLEAARLDAERIGGIVLVDGSRMSGGTPPQAASYATFADGLFGQMFVRPSPQSEAIITRAKRMPAETAVAAFRSMLRWDAEKLEAALAAVRAPLMVIQSTWINAERRRDCLKAGQTSPWLELLKQRVPGVRIEVVPGVGHFTQLEAAASVNRLIGEACRSTGAP
jgi:pimeloyl-ACP methyl ester carboxylesterase